MIPKQKDPISLFKWIWSSYLRTALIPLILVELVFIGIYFFTNSWSQTETINFLKKEVQTELQESSNQQSMAIQQQLLGVSYITEIFAQQTAKALGTPTTISVIDANRLTYSPDGVYYTQGDREDGGAAIFYTGIVPVGPNERDKVARTLTLQNLLKDMQQSHPLIASLYLNTFDSLNIIYPYFDVITQFAPLTDIPTFNFYYEADEEHNPTREVKWTDAYLDPAGHGWMASSIAPVYTGDFLEGVVGIDITISTVTNQILNMDIPWEGYGVLIGKDGTILALPSQGEIDWGLTELMDHNYSEAIKQNTFKPDQFNIYKIEELDSFSQQIAKNSRGFSTVMLNGNSRVVSWATVPETGWKLLVIVPEANIYAKVNEMSHKLYQIGAYMIGGLIFFYGIFFFLLSRKARKMSIYIASPLVEINDMVQRIGSGDYFQKKVDFPVLELQETSSKLVDMGGLLGTANQDLMITQAALKKREADLQALVNSIGISKML